MEELIKYLEEKNLLEKLLEKIHYINFVTEKRVLGNSSQIKILKRMELNYRTEYFIDNQLFYKEDKKSITYDEADCLFNPGITPVKCYEKVSLTKEELILLLKQLPREKILLLVSKIGISSYYINSFFDKKTIEKAKNDALTTIALNKNDSSVLIKCMSDMQVSLYTMISILGEKISQEDIKNIDKIIQKATRHLNKLSEETKMAEIEREYTLKLK